MSSSYVCTEGSKILKSFNEGFLQLPEGLKLTRASIALKNLCERPCNEVVLDYGFSGLGDYRNIRTVREQVASIQTWITRTLSKLDSSPIDDFDEFQNIEIIKPYYGWVVEIRDKFGSTHNAHLDGNHKNKWVLENKATVPLSEYTEWRYCSFHI